jgi:hypothetical protein
MLIALAAFLCVAALVGFVIMEAVPKIGKRLWNAAKNVLDACFWGMERLDRYLTVWRDAALFGVGAAALGISIYIISGQRQNLLAENPYARGSDYNPPNLEFALMMVGCLIAMVAFWRLFLRLTYQISKWWDHRRLAA